MWETEWENIKKQNDEIVSRILEYNTKIIQGDYLEYPHELQMDVYYNLIAAHIVNILIDDETLYIPNDIFLSLNLHNSDSVRLIEWDIVDGNRFAKDLGNINKDEILAKLLKGCFNDNTKKFICEICAQDIIYSFDLAKKISSLLNSIYVGVELAVKGEEVLIRRLSEMRRTGVNLTKSSKIQSRYNFEYKNTGALVRNRVFKHNYTGKHFLEKVKLPPESEELLDYRSAKNFCQSALLHIGIEETGSSGTGFMISSDGYALTCAHVVEGAKEVYATVINGDGYAAEGLREGFEVYDAGNGEVVYINKSLDIALLKMEHYGSGFLPIEQRNILPELGEEVVVFGYPLGYEMPQSNFFGPNISFYKGYVSSNQTKDGNSVTFLDIDVKSGNSGSPVISTKTGKVIGIMSGIKVGGKIALTEKMPYMIPIQHFLVLNS